MEKMVNEFLPLAAKIAREFSNIPGLPHAEIELAAQEALANAARLFEPEKGELTAYAARAMRNALRKVAEGIRDGKSYSEIGASLGISKQAAHKLAGAAITTLREKLAAMGLHGIDTLGLLKSSCGVSPQAVPEASRLKAPILIPSNSMELKSGIPMNPGQIMLAVAPEIRHLSTVKALKPQPEKCQTKPAPQAPLYGHLKPLPQSLSLEESRLQFQQNNRLARLR